MGRPADYRTYLASPAWQERRRAGKPRLAADNDALHKLQVRNKRQQELAREGRKYPSPRL